MAIRVGTGEFGTVVAPPFRSAGRGPIQKQSGVFFVVTYVERRCRRGRKKKMNDHRDSKRGKDHFEDRLLKQSEKSRLRSEVQELLRKERENPHSKSRAADELARLDRISERSSMRRLHGFDPRKELQMEKLEIRQGKGMGFLRRHLGEGLDAATRRDIRKELVELERGGELDWMPKCERKASGGQELTHEAEIRSRLSNRATDGADGGHR